ncbi:MAG TPA: hypothetical protein VEI73_14135 [Candidatus Acidoferrum sp.]|nr:hypothetical protein [Candidatus Acidoferrum sp.]
MTTQAPIDPRQTRPHHHVPRVEVYWTAVTYKTVILCVLVGGGLISGGIYVAKPEFFPNIIKKIDENVKTPEYKELEAAQKRAKFVNLDGKVEVKKKDSIQWVEADFRVTLDKGDQIKTGPDGAARITFADGTTYTMKPDALVTVEENSTQANSPSSSAIGITTGEVNWATPTWTLSESKAEVRVEDTRAELGSNSRGLVKADPDNKSSEITVSSGNAQVQRGAEHIELTNWQKATVTSGTPIQKTDVLAPPEPLQPLNLAPIISENPKAASIHFEWKPVQDAISYKLRISTTAMFTKTVFDKTVSGTSLEITGLDVGDYFWDVSATDAKKQISEVSAPYKFTVVAQGKSQEMLLEITSTQVQGRNAEIVGRSEPGAALIINGLPVPNIAPDGTFHYFVGPLEPGQHTIVVMGSNRRGGTNMKQFSIVVPK